MSLFAVVQDPYSAESDMGHNLDLVTQWAHYWRMLFNSYQYGQAVELVLSTKRHENRSPNDLFNDILAWKR